MLGADPPSMDFDMADLFGSSDEQFTFEVDDEMVNAISEMLGGGGGDQSVDDLLGSISLEEIDAILEQLGGGF